MNRLKRCVIAGITVSMFGALGCSAEVDVPGALGSEAQSIINGSQDTADLQVVMVDMLDSQNQIQGLCSGTLITPRVVLLAAHCFVEIGATGAIVQFAYSFDFFTNTYTGQLTPSSRTASAYWFDPTFNLAALLNGDSRNDVALLYLDGPPPASVKPATIYRQRLTNATALNKSDRFVGFGDRTGSSTSSLFERLFAVATVTLLGEQQLAWNSGSARTCQGDSGGPHFMTIDGKEVIVGVTSFGRVGCMGESDAQRTDVELTNILKFISDHDPQPTANCGADGICGWNCPDIDPDCPCVSDGKCTAACTNPDQDPDCPLNCNADGVCQRTGCPTADPDCGTKVTGATCTTSTECASGICVPNGSSRECVPACDTGGICPSGFSCASASNTCFPSSGGGCAVVPESHAGPGLASAALLLAALVWRRRRRTA